MPVIRRYLKNAGVASETCGSFEHVTREDIEAIPSEICNSITLSTMHGCPPQEIENIVTYLLKEKHIHTYVKCNPTLLDMNLYAKQWMIWDMTIWHSQISISKMTFSMKMQCQC